MVKNHFVTVRFKRTQNVFLIHTHFIHFYNMTPYSYFIQIERFLNNFFMQRLGQQEISSDLIRAPARLVYLSIWNYTRFFTHSDKFPEIGHVHFVCEFVQMGELFDFVNLKLQNVCSVFITEEIRKALRLKLLVTLRKHNQRIKRKERGVSGSGGVSCQLSRYPLNWEYIYEFRVNTWDLDLCKFSLLTYIQLTFFQCRL